MAFDPYRVLGVSQTASTEEIRVAFRNLARKHHPDISQDNESEQQFKEISRAYAILVNSEKRRLFDEFGEVSTRIQFDAQRFRQQQVESDPPPKRREVRQGKRALDVTSKIQIDRALAKTGGSIRVQSPVGGFALSVIIPAGAKTGDSIRLPGKGAPGLEGVRPGDLYLEIEIRDTSPKKK